MTDAIEAVAPAKLNLFLHITGRRPDGYHLLNSVVCFTEIGDRLCVEPATDLSLTIDGSFAATLPTDDSDNLVLRAARVLAEEAGIAPQAAITLTKELPIGAGIGGGSSDAATTLRLLNQLWSVRWPKARLAEIALKLGSDVPACLEPSPAQMQGVGEVLSPVTLVNMPPYCVLVWPGQAVSTPLVYQAYKKAASPFAQDTVVNTRWTLEALQQQSNMLEGAACQLAPVVAEAMAQLRSTQGAQLVRMSGSGSCCTAFYRERTQAEQSAHTIASYDSNWWVRVSRLKEQ